MKRFISMAAKAALTFGLTTFLLAAAHLSAAQTPDNTTETIVLRVGNDDVTLEDFEHVFRKNNKDSVTTTEALDAYMELFVNFKLKVLEAEALGMDTVAAFQKELAGYRNQLARPYMVDSELLSELVEEAYERKSTEVRASHILISVAPDASPADTLLAWNRIQTLRDRVIHGDNFGEVARSKGGSEDPSVANNGGDLGWFTAFQMVYPFECAAYETAEGDVSDVVRTRFGYHILKVTGKRKARGEVQVAHIMVRMPRTASKNQVTNAEGRMMEVKRLLMNGEAFESLAMKYSEDPSTANKGGVLPWFGTGKMVEDFEEAAFAMSEVGDIAGPVRTDYGFHLIKLLDKKTLPTLDESRRELSKKVRRDSRADITKTSFLRQLKKEYGVTIDMKRLDALQDAAARVNNLFSDGTPLTGVCMREMDLPLFSVDSKPRLVSDFVSWVNARDVKDLTRPKNKLISEEVDAYVEEVVLAYEDSRLEAKHNDFRLLMEEYHDGILLFELTDQQVWSRAVQDSAGLESFHAANPELFTWPQRLDVGIHTCEDEAISRCVKRTIRRKKDVQGLRRELIAERPLALRNEFGKFAEGENVFVDRAFEALREGNLEPDSYGLRVLKTTEGGSQVILVHLKDVIEAAPKTLRECRGAAIAAYQDHLEETWLEELRGKYPHRINLEALHSLADQ